MKQLLRIATSKWFYTFLGAFALGLIIWVLGALLGFGGYHPLENDAVRLLLALLPIIAAAAWFAVASIRNAKKNQTMVATLTQGDAGAAKAESAAEIETLRVRIEEALAVLKKTAAAKNRGRYLYHLPWYMIIGPPGSGKTTALKNSGLNFPLSAKYGKDAVRGVGGTRNCDWWFTDEAVLLDTAGRYVTQDSNAAADEGAWKGFLALLKRFRPRQPINGALVAISIAEIAASSPDRRMAHALAIRQRLKELSEAFSVRFPVYVVFSKLDLIAGFTEFFDDLGKEDREQVWGMTLPMDGGGDAEPPSVNAFAEEFATLVSRLNDRLLERVQNEVDLSRRALIYAFPTQIASLEEPLSQFLQEIFLPNRYEGRPLLRGVYLTSATQEGTPVDRLMSAMAASFGLDRQQLGAFGGTGRSFFLTRLLRNVVFAEANMVGSDARAEQRQRLLRRLGYAAAGLGALACAAAWTVSYFGNRALVADIDGKLSTYSAAAAPFASPEVSDGDLLRVLPLLNALRSLPTGYDARDEGVPFALGFGLYQGRKIGNEAVAAYRKALGTLYLPRLLVRLGAQIRSKINDPDYVNAALEVYLMLGNQGPPSGGPDRALIRQLLQSDWREAVQGPDAENVRSQLLGHLDALLEEEVPSIPLDGALIAQARQTLLQSPLASRAYSSIKLGTEAGRLREWTIIEHGGASVDRVIVRSSGKRLAEGVPGFYTKKGFYDVLIPATTDLARNMARERWVLGDAAPAGPDDAVVRTLERDVMQLYVRDYITQWDALLSDIAVVPLRNMQEAAAVTNFLSQPDSPLKLLLTAAAAETQLSHPPQAAASASGATGTAALAAGAIAAKTAGDAAARLAAPAGSAASTAASAAAANLAATGNAAAPPPQAALAQAVDDHFQKLRDFVGLGGSGPAPVDDLLRNLNALYTQINGLAQPGQDLVAKSVGDTGAGQQLAAQASRFPSPVGAMVATLARGASNLTAGGARNQINENWQSKVLPFCQSALTDRYPFFRGGANDVLLDDFTKLFAPNGLIDAFFAANLKPFVDTSRRPWRWQKVDNAELGIAADVLVQFQRAAAIRDGFFANGPAAPSVKFEIVPVELDAAAASVVVDVDGQSLSYAHGPQLPTPFQWPAAGGVHAARIAFPTTGGAAPGIAKSGAWSLFRLLDDGQMQRTNQAERLRVSFAAGGHHAAFELLASSVINPLTMTEVREFRCPARM